MEAIATGVELKMRANRTSAARKSSSPLISPGARLMTSEREGPGAPSLENATLWRIRAGSTLPRRGFRSTSNCCVVTSPGRPETIDRIAPPSPAMRSPTLSWPGPNCARS